MKKYAVALSILCSASLMGAENVVVPSEGKSKSSFLDFSDNPFALGFRGFVSSEDLKEGRGGAGPMLTFNLNPTFGVELTTDFEDDDGTAFDRTEAQLLWRAGHYKAAQIILGVGGGYDWRFSDFLLKASLGVEGKLFTEKTRIGVRAGPRINGEGVWTGFGEIYTSYVF